MKIKIASPTKNYRPDDDTRPVERTGKALKAKTQELRDYSFNIARLLVADFLQRIK